MDLEVDSGKHGALELKFLNCTVHQQGASRLRARVAVGPVSLDFTLTLVLCALCGTVFALQRLQEFVNPEWSGVLRPSSGSCQEGKHSDSALLGLRDQCGL